ncbi:serine hydrolase [Nesterenkonia sp. HG001]|uniref:serine hydrolase domain-containing protein n=1 Tax=Nesterenkonia sp. HG001 TaxID=2983207 RepID=UPI002AC4AAAA|nr:serine hydrolase [Nesterenkonia sp. HG001]MDZ5077221.1 beta-lactamase family protein [Nesterenkonia sp. HG001]
MPHRPQSPTADWFRQRVEGHLIPRLQAHGLVMHSLLAVHQGQLRHETYWLPYGPERPHRLYSAGKSLVSLAVGALVDDGALALDDLLVDHFPEHRPRAHPWVRAMRVEDLLSMRTAHGQSTYAQVADPDWVRTFFTVPPSRPPGTVFAYDTSATLVLTALVERLTGLPFEEFFAERIGRHLGMEAPLRALRSPLGLPSEAFDHHPTWREVAENPAGVAHGGSGLLATPRDLARIAQLCLQQGRAGGRQVISGEFLCAATSVQTPTVAGGFAHPEAQLGYGHQFWRCRRQSFAAWGMGGQIMLVVPWLEAAVVVTGDNQHIESDAQLLHDTLWGELLDPLAEQVGAAPGEVREGASGPVADGPAPLLEIPDDVTAPRELAGVSGAPLPMWLAHDAGTYRASFALETGPGRQSEALGAGEELVGLEIRSTGDLGELTLRTADGRRLRFPYRYGGHARHDLPGYGYETHTSGAWLDGNTLSVHAHVVGDWLAQIQLLVHVGDGAQMVCRMRASAEFFAQEFDGLLIGRQA